MFGATWRDHDVRYTYATEWVDFVRRLWSEEREFDYTGRFFQSRRAWSQPKPLQKPFPPIMNADMNFLILRQRDFAGGKAQIDALKSKARAVGRTVQVWIHVYVVCRETEAEARRVKSSMRSTRSHAWAWTVA